MKSTLLAFGLSVLGTAAAQDCVTSPHNGDFAIQSSLGSGFAEGWLTRCFTTRSVQSRCGVTGYEVLTKDKAVEPRRDPGTGRMFECTGDSDGQPINPNVPYGPERNCQIAQEVDLCPSKFGNDYIFSADFIVTEPSDYYCYPYFTVFAPDGTISSNVPATDYKVTNGEGWVTRHILGQGTAAGGRTGLKVELRCYGNATAYMDNIRLATF